MKKLVANMRELQDIQETPSHASMNLSVSKRAPAGLHKVDL
jgi:hypothetical protein